MDRLRKVTEYRTAVDLGSHRMTDRRWRASKDHLIVVEGPPVIGKSSIARNRSVNGTSAIITLSRVRLPAPRLVQVRP